MARMTLEVLANDALAGLAILAQDIANGVAALERVKAKLKR